MNLPKARVYNGGRGGKRTGVVVAAGRAVQDEQGLFHPLGLTCFWAMQGWKHERPRFQQNAEWAASKGFDYLRILTEVNWKGREIDPSSPAWSDWGTVLREVMDYLYGLGLRVELTLIGKGTATDPIWLAREVGAIVAEGRQHMVVDLECCNEYAVGDHKVSIGTLIAMAYELKARTPNIIALSSPGTWPTLEAGATMAGIQGFTVHSDRGSSDFKWRQVRQPYDFKNTRLVAFNNEPPGPSSSVNTNTSPLQLAMMRALGVMCGGTGYVLHTGTGVFGDGQGHPTAGPRPANFWEIDDIDAIVAAVRGVDPLLPAGVENWQVANTQHLSGNVVPFQVSKDQHWEGSKGTGVNKAYAALAPDGRVIQMPIGVRGHVSMTASYPLTGVTVFDPVTAQPVAGLTDRSFVRGEVLDLPGGGQDAMVAYIIHGRRA